MFQLLLASALILLLHENDAFQLSVIHLNDFHASYDQVSKKSSEFVGGFSRIYTAKEQLMKKQPESIFLCAGDNYQGTLWYNLFKWNVTQYFINMLSLDAMTLGNHEFDDSIDGLVPFLKRMKIPVVVCNIDDSLEPSLQGLYTKSVVIEREGKRIGIVGVMPFNTNTIARTRRLKFLDEITSVNEEARRLMENEGVFTVVVLSHCGYDTEQKIAKSATNGISLIVGGHTHTLLYTGTPPSGHALGPYPTVVKNPAGADVLVVQASSHSKYLGHIMIDYDESGNVVSWSGNPIYLDNKIPQDEKINALLDPWRQLVTERGSQIIGHTNVFLQDSNCRYEECSMGNFLSDAFAQSYVPLAEPGSWTYASIAIINPAGSRKSLNVGNITFDDIATVQPYGNTMDVLELQGGLIKAMMEMAATPYERKYRESSPLNLLQVSGMRVVIDVGRCVGSRVTSLKVLCRRCSVPHYEDIKLRQYYRVVLPSFLVGGGDGYRIIGDNLRNHKIGEVDLDILIKYIEKHTPITTGVDGRITIIN